MSTHSFPQSTLFWAPIRHCAKCKRYNNKKEKVSLLLRESFGGDRCGAKDHINKCKLISTKRALVQNAMKAYNKVNLTYVTESWSLGKAISIKSWLNNL